MGVVVEFEVGHADDGVVVAHRLGAAQHGTDAGHHLVEAEGLGHIVVAADGQAGDLVVGVIPCGEEDDGEMASGGP